MKNLLSTFILSLFFVSSTAQEVIDFVDDNFRLKLIELGVDSNNDNEIQLSEAEKVLYLDISSSNISDISGINHFSSLISLNASYNFIESIMINDIESLQNFNCSYNSITSIELSRLNSLQSLSCSYNQIKTLHLEDFLNLSLIYCSNNKLTSLELKGLSDLKVLDCSANELEEINVLEFKNLEFLTIGNNKLSGLDLSNLSNVKVISCQNNNLLELNINRLVNLESLYCSDNELFQLDLSEAFKLKHLDCRNNNLIYLYMKNGILDYYVSFENNPELKYICVDDFEVEYFEDLLSPENELCKIETYCPHTSEGNPFLLTGSVKFSWEGDECEGSDYYYSFPKVLIEKDNGTKGFIVGNTNGQFGLYVDAGSYAISAGINNIDYFKSEPETVTIEFPNAKSPYIQDFCFVPDGVFNDLEVVIIPTNLARPGFNTKYKVKIRNVGNTSIPCELLFVFESELMDFVSSNPEQDSINDNKIYLNFDNIEPFEEKGVFLEFKLNTPTETPPLNGGDELHFVTTVNSVFEDFNRSNNTFHLYQDVINSYDPNDKICLEGSTLTPEMVGEYAHYMIRFENTGTAEAVNIVVRDSIDPQSFEISTLQIIEASHDLETRINDGNIVEFIFKDIYLPFEDATNDGYVVFKIKTRDDLVLGDVFENTAEIYFDYNFPIITNTASTEVAIPLNNGEVYLNEDLVNIYPNPASDNLQIESEEAIKSISLLTMYGKLISKHVLISNTRNYNVNLGDLVSGIYLIEVTTANGKVLKRMVRE